MATTYELIASQTLGSDASSITLSSIPATFDDLVCVAHLRGTEAGVATRSLRMRLNGDTGSNYSYRWLRGSGSAATSGSNTNVYSYMGIIPAATATANTFASVEIVIPNYAGSANKSVSSTSASENNATAADIVVAANLWSSASAITSIQLYPESDNLISGSSVYLYGITKS